MRKYLDKISGPLLDRIDIQIEVPAVKYDDMNSSTKAESSEVVRQRVNKARAFRLDRIKAIGVDALHEDKKENCAFTKEAEDTMKLAFEKLSLSARGYDRIVKVARTIADLALSPTVERAHVLEAVQLRSLDRKYFNVF